MLFRSNDTATTEIYTDYYTLSLHDALPIWAGLVETATGKAGKTWLARDPKQISLLNIYQAVDAPRAFAIHNYAEQKGCLVSCHIKQALDKALGKTQKAMESSLGQMSLAQVVTDVKKK